MFLIVSNYFGYWDILELAVGGDEVANLLAKQASYSEFD